MTRLAKSPSGPDGNSRRAPGKIHMRLLLAVIAFNSLIALRLAWLVYPQLQTVGYDCWSDSDFWLLLANVVLVLVNGRHYLMMRRQAGAQ